MKPYLSDDDPRTHYYCLDCEDDVDGWLLYFAFFGNFVRRCLAKLLKCHINLSLLFIQTDFGEFAN